MVLEGGVIILICCVCEKDLKEDEIVCSRCGNEEFYNENYLNKRQNRWNEIKRQINEIPSLESEKDNLETELEKIKNEKNKLKNKLPIKYDNIDLDNIIVTKQPNKLEYNISENISLRGLEVKLVWSDGTSDDNITYDQFGDFNLRVEPDHGNEVVKEYNRQPIVITHLPSELNANTKKLLILNEKSKKSKKRFSVIYILNTILIIVIIVLAITQIVPLLDEARDSETEIPPAETEIEETIVEEPEEEEPAEAEVEETVVEEPEEEEPEEIEEEDIIVDEVEEEPEEIEEEDIIVDEDEEEPAEAEEEETVVEEPEEEEPEEIEEEEIIVDEDEEEPGEPEEEEIIVDEVEEEPEEIEEEDIIVDEVEEEPEEEEIIVDEDEEEPEEIEEEEIIVDEDEEEPEEIEEEEIIVDEVDEERASRRIIDIDEYISGMFDSEEDDIDNDESHTIDDSQRDRIQDDLEEKDDELASAEEFYNLSKEYLNENNYSDALLNIERAIEINPNELEYYKLRKDIYINSGEVNLNKEYKIKGKAEIRRSDLIEARDNSVLNATQNALIKVIENLVKKNVIFKDFQIEQLSLYNEPENHNNIVNYNVLSSSSNEQGEMVSEVEIIINEKNLINYLN